MRKLFDEIRLFLFTCSGEDNYILKKCSIPIQLTFAVLGFFVLIIFIGCFLSATFFIGSLFEGAKWISLPMGLVWGAVIVNLYLLLLHTISPPIIPLSSKKKKKNQKITTKERTYFLTPSMLFRLTFMALLAIITAQPLNVYCLSSSVQIEMEKHKMQERVKLYTLSNETLIQKELQNLNEFNQKIIQKLNNDEIEKINKYLFIVNNKIQTDQAFVAYTSKKMQLLDKIDAHIFLNSKEKKDKKNIINDLENKLNDELGSDEKLVSTLNTIKISGNIGEDYNKFKSNLSDLINKKITNYNNLTYLLDKSNFYIKTIQLLLVENPFSWLITFFVCLVFLSPIYIKYKVRDISASIFKKEEINEPEIIKLREELIDTKNFNWLEKKIKSTNIQNIKTSDYYFRRMLIEHKIILEEYDETKVEFSNILSEKIKKFNRDSLSRLVPLLQKLKDVNLKKYNDLNTQIYNEYKDEIIVKYEYWLDMPFRTKRQHIASVSNNEDAFLDFVYNQKKEPDNL